MNPTDEEIRIKVAEACGLKFVRAGYIEMPKAQEVWPDHWQDTRGKRKRIDGSIVGTPVTLPNYPLDLNACAKFEAELTKSERTRYADILCDMCYDGEPDPNVEQVISATARQRCLAYLKTKGIIP